MKKRYLIAIAILLVFSILMFLITHFSNATVLSTEGFFVSGEEIEEILLSEVKLSKSKNVKLEKVSYDDTFYTNLDKLYIGEEKKIEVNSNYPVFSNKGVAIVNINEKSKLVNSDFEYLESYENFTLTGGKLYNYGDLEQADYEDYIFLQLPNGTYMNLYPMVVKSITKTYEIPVNSIIAFYGDYLKYYSYDNSGKLIYNINDGIDLYSEFTMGDVNFTYKDLLIFVGKIDADSLDDDVSLDAEEDKTDESEGDTDRDEGVGTVKYVKPKVSVSNFTTNVYSASSKLTISDPAGVIVGGITFQFKIGDKIYLRKSFISSGNFKVTGLVPNTEFTIIGSYRYYNEESKKIENTFFEQKIKTGDMSNLKAIDIGFENGEVYSNKLELNNLRITSDLENEAINGISKGIVYINGEAYNIPSSSVKELIAGKSVKYTSPASLDSNTKINYEIRFLDAYSNVIKVSNNKGQSRTSKIEPTVIAKQTSGSVTSITFNILLNNPDHVNINSYRYVIYDKNMTVVYSKDLEVLDSQDVSLENLDPNSTYSIKVFGNYDIESGKGIIKDAVLGEGKFTTLPLSSLGYLRVKTGTKELTSKNAVLDTYVDTTGTSAVLLTLINKFKVTVLDENDEVVYTKQYTGNELTEITTGQHFYDTIENLISGTTYNILLEATAKQGSVEEVIPVLYSFKKFSCMKTPASVSIVNKFVTGSMIDFDVRIEDLENTILSNRVILEVRDSTEKLVKMEYLDVNSDYVQLTYDKLDEKTNYTFTYKVEEYNEGYDNRTFKSDHTIYSEVIYTEPGIVGSLQLISLLRQIESRNLFNISDYERIRKAGNTGYKNYDIENNTVTFGGKNGYVNYSYYVPEAYNRSVVVSFYARYSPGTGNKADVYLSKNYNDTKSYLLEGLSDDYQLYTFTYYMTTNYVGFIVNETANVNLQTNVDIKDLCIFDVTSQEDAAANDVKLSYHSSSYKFSDTVMFAGDEAMPKYNGSGTMVGNAGNGYARITNLDTGDITTFSYTGSPQTFNVGSTNQYKVELWGASGGDSSKATKPNNSSRAGYGAYTAGNINLKKGTTLFVYVGGAGSYGAGSNSFGGPVGGYNGGGDGGNSSSGSGGGATDIRVKDGAWNNLESLKSRIMVAAGGGGPDNSGGTKWGADDGSGGAGGTIKSSGAYINGVLNASYFASQSSGYMLGQGQSVTSSTDSGGAGGGFYGGVTTNNNNGGGSGGSSYISGHVGCLAEVDTTYSVYKEKDQYAATVAISLQDSNNELVNDDFYVRIYRKEELVDTVRYELINNQANNIGDVYQLDKNKDYTLMLSVKVRDRFYDIASLEFNTSSEIRSISSVTAFANIHTDGRYIVLTDLDIRSRSAISTTTFDGEIDFQGHKIITNVEGRGNYIIHTLGADGVIKNLVVDYYLDNTAAKVNHYGVLYRNYGIVDNLMINIKESNYQANGTFSLGSYVNYGTIKNFVLNAEAAFSAKQTAGILAWSNQGTIKNGYIYGENIYGYFENNDRSRKDVAPLVGQASTNSKILNVFSLIGVEKDKELSTEDSVSNLVGYSSVGSITNVYSVEDSDNPNTNLSTQDPNIGTYSGGTITNAYYSSDKTYVGGYSLKLSKLALRDSEFQDKLLNSESVDGFDVDSYVPFGFYPHVIMNDCMPRQEMIALPDVSDEDLVDVTSSEQLTVDGDKAEVMLTLNNPGAETITAVGISDINTVEILSQENEYGKTKLKIRISNPISYQSRYYIRSLSITGALGVTYSREYTAYERAIDIDLYYLINDLKDWKILVDNPTQNYMLTTDLDFKTESITQYIISSDFKGKLNGNGHTLKNINISSTSYKAFFNGYITGGTIENLYVENYVKSGAQSYGGLIYRTRSNAKINNVHLKNAEITGTTYVGGLVAYSDNNVTIRNSSVTDLTINVPKDKEIIDIRVGGLVGYLNTGDIYNSFAQNITLDVTGVLSTSGVGGLVGYYYRGTIQNVYATGVIKNNSSNTGGIVGQLDNISLSKAWTNIDIYSELDYVGGIYGKRGNEIIQNTLVAGLIYSSYDGKNINRTVGNSPSSSTNNYAWAKQKFFGYVVGDAIIEELLTTDNLKDSDTYYDRIGFDDNFYYEDISNGSLPKLKNADTGELLPHQKDSLLAEDPISVESVVIDSGVDTAEVSITFDNPNNYNITKVEFDYLNVDTYYGVVNNDGKTTMRIQVTPERGFDSYMLNKIIYTDSSGEHEIVVAARIQKTFYNQISSVDEWNAVAKKGTTENYLLVADLDFAGKTATPNAKIARLEAQGSHTIKNVTLTTTAGNFAFIDLLTKSLKDITFENFNITNTKSGNYVGIINLNYADVLNVNFKDIVINAPKSSYVGSIVRHRGQDMRNVNVTGTISTDDDGNEIYSTRITGVSYVGALAAHSYNLDTINITGSGIQVYGTTNYVGSIMGYKQYSSSATNFEYHVSNVDVTGKGYVGGVFGYGGSSLSSIKDSKIYAMAGNNYVGGFAGQGGQYRTDEVIVDNCDIVAEGNSYVGGMFGWNYYAYYCYVYNTRVTQNGADKIYVGGMIGYNASYTSNYLGIEDSVVTSNGTSTGGLFGALYNMTANYTYTKNVTVNGVDNVGGAVGYAYRGRLYYNTTNAVVNASGSYVGGIFGYVSDLDPKSSSYSTLAHDVILANTNIVSTGTRVGLLAGYTPNPLKDAYYYKILLVGNMSVLEDADVGVVTGYDLDYNTEAMPRIFIYDKSAIMKVNNSEVISNEYVENLSGYNSIIYANPDQMMPDATLLRTAAFYTSSSYMGLSSSYWYTSWTNRDGVARTVVDGYYPKMRYVVDNQPDIELPTAEVTYKLRTNAFMMGHELPEVEVYSSGISSVNIEFDEVDDYTYFEVYENNKKIFGQNLDRRTYSINYNYTSNLKIFVTDGVSKRNYVYKAEDLVNKVSTFDNTYAYIHDGKLSGNFEGTKDTYIHVYGNKALTKDLNVFNIKTGKFISVNNTFGVSLLNDTISLYEFEYDDVLIETYATYSIINKDGEDIIYPNQIFIKNGVFEIVDSELDNVKNSIIIDEYAKDSYVTVLGSDGVIYNLKTNIKVPSAFTNKNIKYMSNNINSKSSVVVVMYNTGKVVVFDYRTGKKVQEMKATEDVSVVDYFKDNFTTGDAILGDDVPNSYNNSLELKELLENKPILVDEDGKYVTNDDENGKNSLKNNVSNYITYYDATKGKYDVVDIGSVIEKGEKEVVPETDKIYSSNDLVNFYMQESFFEKVFGNVNVLIIFIVILVGIFGALLLWLRNIKKLKES